MSRSKKPRDGVSGSESLYSGTDVISGERAGGETARVRRGFPAEPIPEPAHHHAVLAAPSQKGLRPPDHDTPPVENLQARRECCLSLPHLEGRRGEPVGMQGPGKTQEHGVVPEDPTSPVGRLHTFDVEGAGGSAAHRTLQAPRQIISRTRALPPVTRTAA